MPLKGKILNVRDVKDTAKVLKNEEVKAIFEAMGLNKDYDYSDDSKYQTLRYGHVMIMSDQDPDGAHIMGLVVNLFDHFAPTLLKRPGFLKRFITPIVKAMYKRQAISFFSLQEFEKWKTATPNTDKWTIKYYKGLGTSTDVEAKEYFSDLDKHMKTVEYDNPLAQQLIKLSFSKSMADARKKCLGEMDPEAHLDYDQPRFKLSDFVNKELMPFWSESNKRAISCIMDGLKPGQRKILYTCFSRRNNSQIKVAQLQGEVSKVSAYHHGENSLGTTIVGLAQHFVGSNNVNVLMPIGMFGTRPDGGKAAASRYIFTCLSPVARAIFSAQDDPVLTRSKDDGILVEPVYYAAIVCMALINGCTGIGTGWSTGIPNYDAREVVANQLRMLDGLAPLPMHPKYNGFTGTITPNDSLNTNAPGSHAGTPIVVPPPSSAIAPIPATMQVDGKDEKKDSAAAPLSPTSPFPVPAAKAKKGKARGYVVQGAIQKRSDTSLEISELPIDIWPKDYKKKLTKFLEAGKIKDYREDHTNHSLSFTLTLSAEQMASAEKTGFIKAFELESSLSLDNMVLFGADGKLYKYATAVDILKEYYQHRLPIYSLRKEHMISELQGDSEMLRNKVRFINSVIAEEIKVKGVSTKQLIHSLADATPPYTPIPKKKDANKIKVVGDTEMEMEEDDESKEEKNEKDEKDSVKAADYTYLTDMKISSMTLDRVARLKAEYEAKQQQLADLKNVDPKDMWRQDLKHFLQVLERTENEAIAKLQQAGKHRNAVKGANIKKSQRTSAKPKTAVPSRKRKAAIDALSNVSRKRLKM